MGTAPDQLDVISYLYRQGLIPQAATVADVGCQQLWGGTSHDVRNFLLSFGVVLPEDRIVSLSRDATFIGDLFKVIGWSYRSFDIVEAPYCEQFDLNTDIISERYRGTFDLVLNFGTTEHVMNQFNAMKTLHDLTKRNGLIYSYFIRGGYMDHGLVHYSDRFVSLWMEANHYEEVWRSDAPNAACTWIVVRKTTPNDFNAIIDVQLGEGLPALRTQVSRASKAT